MRTLLVVGMISSVGFAAAGVAQAAGTCTWSVTPALQPADDDSGYEQIDDDEYWYWHHVLDHHSMWGALTGETDNANKSDAGSGSGTYTIMRITACEQPAEDIEADAQNQFEAFAELDNDDLAQCWGQMKITANKVSSSKPQGGKLRSIAMGGAEASDTAHGEGSQGTYTVEVEVKGVKVACPVEWSTGGSVTKIYQDNDGGAGGTTIEVFHLDTNLSTQVNLGGTFLWNEYGNVEIRDSKSRLRVWGTCDGPRPVACGVITLLVYDNFGY